MKPILTIAIPTYNRADKLKKCIELIMNEVLGKNIEILVSDNASLDNTEVVMKEILNTYPQIMYYRNSENIGPDRNFLNCFEKAKGEYVWLIGDDDMLLPDAMDSILEALSKKPVFLHLNTSTLISDEPLKYVNARMEDEGILEYIDKNEFFKKMSIHVTFLSALVLRTDLIQEISDKEKYIGTYFIQSHIALKTLENDGLYMINTKNCLAASGNYSVGYDLYFVWGKQYRDLLFTTGVESGIDEHVIRQVHYQNLDTVIKYFVIHFRQTCKNEDQWNKEYIMKSVDSYPDLKKEYDKLVNLSVWKLKIYHFISRVKNKIRRIMK